MTILRIVGLQAYYVTHVYGTTRTVRAVDGVSFSINRNEIFGIAGESGSGKSTLVRVLTRTMRAPLQVQRGNVFFDGDGAREVDLLTIPAKEFERYRLDLISYIPQSSMSVLNPLERIRNIFEDFLAPHRKDITKKEMREFVSTHVKSLGLPIEVLGAYPHELSGGMKQRIAIAIATILNPAIIIADEPTTALDVVAQRGVVQLLKRIKDNERNTIVLVTHDMSVHAYVTDRLAVMYAGKIVEVGDVDDIYRSPLHPYTQYLLSSLPQVGDKSIRASVSGPPPDLSNPPPGCRFAPCCPHVMSRCISDEPALKQAGANRYAACFLVEHNGK